MDLERVRSRVCFQNYFFCLLRLRQTLFLLKSKADKPSPPTINEIVLNVMGIAKGIMPFAERGMGRAKLSP